MNNARYLYFLLALFVLQWVFKKLSEHAARRVAAGAKKAPAAPPVGRPARLEPDNPADDWEEDDIAELERNEEIVRRDVRRPMIPLRQTAHEGETSAEKIREFLQQIASQSRESVPSTAHSAAVAERTRQAMAAAEQPAPTPWMQSKLDSPATTAYDIDTGAYALKTEKKQVLSTARSGRGAPSRERLREAIVWSEILSPPVGWR